MTFERIVADGDHIADIHILDATKKNGAALRMKVIAFYKLKDGKIVEVDELTHLLEVRKPIVTSVTGKIPGPLPRRRDTDIRRFTKRR